MPPAFKTSGALKLIDKNPKTIVEHELQYKLSKHYFTTVN